MFSDICAAAEAIDYVEAHLGEPLSLHAVARALHVSDYYLHHRFTSAAGIPLHSYILRRRLTEAAGQLVDSRAPILDIALEAGYDSQQAFSTRFKAMYKQTPGQFRRGGVFYPLLLRYTLGEPQALSPVAPASEADIPAWLSLCRLAVDGFPCFLEEDFLPCLRAAISRAQAWQLMDGPAAVGCMILNETTGSIDFWAVHPQYKRLGVREALLRAALCRCPGIALSTTTFRAGDPADTGWRAALRRLGFAEAEPLVELGYPTQRLVLRRAWAEELPDA